MAKQLYVFAQIPATEQGTVCPVQADDITNAVARAEQVLGASLRRLGGGEYTDGDRKFFLYFGEQGLAQFEQAIAEAAHAAQQQRQPWSPVQPRW